MFRYIITLTLLLVCLSHSQEVVDIQLDVLNSFNFSSGSSIALNLPNSPSKLDGTLIPCFGAVNMFVGFDGQVSPTDNAYHQLWDSQQLTMTFNFPSIAQPSNVTTLVNANATSTRPLAFQFIASEDFNTNINAKFPMPGNDGKLTLAMTSGGKAATVKFTKTDNINDTYQIYKFVGALPDGAWPFSACGVQQYANPTAAQLQDIGNNQLVATITGLDPSVPTGISIIVTRPDGYQNAYSYGILNDPNEASTTKSSVLVMGIILCFTILFGLM